MAELLKLTDFESIGMTLALWNVLVAGKSPTDMGEDRRRHTDEEVLVKH